MELENQTPLSQDIPNESLDKQISTNSTNAKNSINLFILAAFIILILFLSFGIYTLSIKQKKSSSQTSQNLGLNTNTQKKTFPTAVISTPNITVTTTPTINNQTGWSTYQNTEYKFTISYPNTIKLYTPPIPSLGFIPLCDSNQATPDIPDSIVCLYYPQEIYKDTNFEGGAVSVNVLSTLNTQFQCLDFSGYPSNGTATTKQVNGITFQTISAGQGATGHTIENNFYNTFYKNTCFQLEVSLDKFRDDGETPKSFTQDEETTVFSLLNQILSTFKFTN